MNRARRLLPSVAACFLVAGSAFADSKMSQAELDKRYPAGYSDTEWLPGNVWRVHDIRRPRPQVVTPGAGTSAPSDAVVLFDGTSLDEWEGMGRGKDRGKTVAPAWKLFDGYMEVLKGVGSIRTKAHFGDVQLHLEWAAPAEVIAQSQGRGNSGVLIMGLYEIQVLDSYENKSYADGQAGAIYGQYPPLVNSSRKPGEWQTYDIIFEAPRFDGDKLVKPAFATVIHNGVLLHHRQELMGPMRHKVMTEYTPHPAEGPIMLQNHANPVRYRNIWARRLQLQRD